MNDVKSVLFVGVGGQGTILASKTLVQGLIKYGYDVKMSEVHGMAQRGGSVTTQVRFGKKVYSPLVEKGKADVVVSFEKSEGARYLSYLKEGGYLILNDYEIDPVPVLIGNEKYPEKVIQKLSEAVDNKIIINASKIAEEIGNVKAQNIILLGALIKVLNIDTIDWNKILEETLPKKIVDINKKALLAGINACGSNI